MAKSAFTADPVKHLSALQGLWNQWVVLTQGCMCCQTAANDYLSLCCIHFYHLVHTQHSCLCPYRRYNQPLAAHPTPLPPAHPLIRAIRDITVAVKNLLLKIQQC